MTYRAPLKEMQFFLRELAGVEEVCGTAPFEDATRNSCPPF